MQRERTIVMPESRGEIADRLADQGGAEVKLRIVGVLRQKFLASAEGRLRLPSLAQHRDGSLGSLKISRIERERPFERGERALELAHRMAARAEQEPRLCIIRLLGAEMLEQNCRLAVPPCLEQAQGVTMRIKSHEWPRIESAPEERALPRTNGAVLLWQAWKARC